MRSTASTASSTIIRRSRQARSSGSNVGHMRGMSFLIAALLSLAIPTSAAATETELKLGADDVIPTGNDWIALPSIRARDAALMDFNVISMRYRGLIEYAGPAGQP